jgi:lipopolysaccharide transport system ATP-binding protein
LRLDKDVAIKVENVSKKYCKSLKHSMVYGINDIGRNLFGLGSHPEKLRENEFWAVDDVSFEVRKGEALGLIGPNGSGKSTILKMLNGIFWPDKGKITVKGRVGALIEVGAGFHPLLTGRENIYVNGAILGMTKEEVDAKFDDILDFAEIGDFIDSPVKTYSSGMFVRLGFSVAAHCEPDILLVDEVLAVGDFSFQRKCARYIAKLMDNCAVILVSHSVHSIRFSCERVLFLDRGKTQFLGPTSEGLDKYVNYMLQKAPISNGVTMPRSKYDHVVDFKSLEVFDNNHNVITEIDAGQTLVIECAFIAIKPISQAILGVSFHQEGLERTFIRFSSQVEGKQYYDLAEGEHKFQIIIPKVELCAAMYTVGVRISEGNELAEHDAIGDKRLLVKNPHPEFGLYNMNVQFEMSE